jgi:hypothetical protein
MRHFNRHEHMDAETRRAILETITALMILDCKTFSVVNCLYGFFDGFDYSEAIPEMEEMELIKKESPDLYFKILGFCFLVSKYPDGHTQV